MPHGNPPRSTVLPLLRSERSVSGYSPTALASQVGGLEVAAVETEDDIIALSVSPPGALQPLGFAELITVELFVGSRRGDFVAAVRAGEITQPQHDLGRAGPSITHGVRTGAPGEHVWPRGISIGRMGRNGVRSRRTGIHLPDRDRDLWGRRLPVVRNRDGPRTHVRWCACALPVAVLLRARESRSASKRGLTAIGRASIGSRRRFGDLLAAGEHHRGGHAEEWEDTMAESDHLFS